MLAVTLIIKVTWRHNSLTEQSIWFEPRDDSEDMQLLQAAPPTVNTEPFFFPLLDETLYWWEEYTLQAKEKDIIVSACTVSRI